MMMMMMMMYVFNGYDGTGCVDVVPKYIILSTSSAML